MTMRLFTLFLLIIMAMGRSNGQESAVRAVVDRMFQAMYDRDTAALRTCFIPAANLLTYAYDSRGNPRAKGETVADFQRGVALIGEADLEERLTGWHCLIDKGIATVWTPYEFYFEGAFSHCGVNSFELIEVQGDWKISQLTDTRRKGDCVSRDAERVTIDSLMNIWHHAAAVADEEVFFGFMTPEAIYIGTDPTERWLRDELRAWSEKYFARESAWAFTPLSRHVELSADGTLAWLDELLDTWMGVCRSTGILERQEGGWKLVYYHLSMAVPNEHIDAYRRMLGLPNGK